MVLAGPSMRHAPKSGLSGLPLFRTSSRASIFDIVKSTGNGFGGPGASASQPGSQRASPPKGIAPGAEETWPQFVAT